MPTNCMAQKPDKIFRKDLTVTINRIKKMRPKNDLRKAIKTPAGIQRLKDRKSKPASPPAGIIFCRYCADVITSNQSSIKVPNPLRETYGIWHLDCYNNKQADDATKKNPEWGKME